MKIERAIEILTPDATKYTPKEYSEALSMARDALRGTLAVINTIGKENNNESK